MLVPSIQFPGTCAEAHELYKLAFGLTVHNITHYDYAPGDYHGKPMTDEMRKLIMHSECSIYGIRVNMADNTDAVTAGNMIHMNVFLKSEDEVRKAFAVLKEGGVVDTELGPQFWTDLYCSLTDRFGVSWQIMTE
jgi:PhnB protein